MPEDNIAWNGDVPPTEPPTVQEHTPFSSWYTLDNNVFLARVESMLVHKYVPDFVQTFILQSRRALENKDMYRKDSHLIFTDPDMLIRSIVYDISSVPLRHQNADHHPKITRPGIGREYQQELFGEE